MAPISASVGCASAWCGCQRRRPRGGGRAGSPARESGRSREGRFGALAATVDRASSRLQLGGGVVDGPIVCADYQHLGGNGALWMILILQFRQIHRVHADECGGAGSRPTLLYHNSRPTRSELSFALIMVERARRPDPGRRRRRAAGRPAGAGPRGRGLPGDRRLGRRGRHRRGQARGDRPGRAGHLPRAPTTGAWCCRRSVSSASCR